MSGTIISSCLLILFLNWSTAAPAESSPSLVPRIDIDGFQLVPENNQYHLRIDNFEGAVREETVEQSPPGYHLVRGTTNEWFPGLVSLKVTYEAGPNGYYAKYSYGEALTGVQHLPPATLKSIVG